MGDGRRGSCALIAKQVFPVVRASHLRFANEHDRGPGQPAERPKGPARRAEEGVGLLCLNNRAVAGADLAEPDGVKKGVHARVGLIADIPDMAAWQELMQSEAGADAMKFDGVRPETLVVLTEA
jgi:hypothetical protein